MRHVSFRHSRIAAVGSTLATAAALLLSQAAPSVTATVPYEPSDAVIANPERGLYHHSGDCDKESGRFTAARLARYRTEDEKITLVMCIFYLNEFKATPISAAQLARFKQQAAAVRGAGMKMILRFAYTQLDPEGDVPPPGDDAPLPRVLAHLDQLAPHLRANRDVIAVVQSGFVGTWGEGAYSQNFGNAGAQDWAKRKQVIDKLLAILPTDRMVQLRTPLMKESMYSPITAPVTEAAAYGGTPVARLGHHNDCFLASDTDFGTYRRALLSQEYDYLRRETNYVVMGGETCNAKRPPVGDARTECGTALAELSMFHYSYLNKRYRPEVITQWTDEGCMAGIENGLGYRFALHSSTFPATVARGQTMPVQLEIENAGWSAPFNPRPVQLILRNKATAAVHRLTTRFDPRRWHAGPVQPQTFNQPVTIPTSVPAGTYDLLLSLPDPRVSPANPPPAYAIQLANTGLWEPLTGFNDLKQTITVG